MMYRTTNAVESGAAAIALRARMMLAAIVGTLVFALGCSALAGDVAVHSSNRYYQDAAGNPTFLVGYYDWAAVPDGYYIDHPSRYAVMITNGAPYEINYIRISLGVNRMTSTTVPPSWNGVPTPVPFLYVNGKADLDQWDSVFWDGLKAQCQLAKDNGVIVHVAIFDGVELRYQGGESYGYLNSFWKPSNQTTTFYPDPDYNSNGQIDDAGEFYQTTAFNNNTGIGYYQKRLIDKVTSDLASYDNVFYEIGNELLSSDSAWNTAVINYINSKTSKPVSQCGGSMATSLEGWGQHSADTPAQVKSNVAAIVGQGYPAWEDPDGPALSDPDVSADDLRRAAWYSFAGGAACWGGFTADYWNGGRGLWIPTVTYYRNLQTFIEDSGVPFWEMTPQHSLVGNNSENSCLAKTGSQYVAYVLNDATVDLNLSGVSGSVYYRLYDPKTGGWTSQLSVAGGAVRTFYKPAGADDWVVHVYPDSIYGPYCYADSFSYPNGALNGNGNWSGSASASRIEVVDQHVRIWGGAGSYDAVQTVGCGDPGTGYILVSCRICGCTGARTMWNLWINDADGKNLARWYGTGWSARGRIGNTSDVTPQQTLTGGWDTIDVKIDPYANTSQFFFNGTSIGTLSHASQGAGDAIGQLRFESMDNWEAAGHCVYFDDLQIGEEQDDTTPPGPVTNFGAIPEGSKLTLTWTNPTDPDFAGTRILYRTTGYPTGPNDGTVIYDAAGTSFAHTGLTHGVTYYYAAYAHDGVPNYSTAALTSGVPYYFRDTFSYANGPLNGNGGWTGSAGSSQIAIVDAHVLLYGGAGSYDAYQNVYCAANPSGYIWERCYIHAGVGGRTIWNLWINDTAGKNLARWYGTAWTARGRIGNTSNVTPVQNLTGGGTWDEIAVRINPAANTSEFFFNGNSIGTLSHASEGGGDICGRLRFERIDNWEAVGHYLYFDDLRLGGN